MTVTLASPTCSKQNSGICPSWKSEYMNRKIVLFEGFTLLKLLLFPSIQNSQFNLFLRLSIASQPRVGRIAWNKMKPVRSAQVSYRGVVWCIIDRFVLWWVYWYANTAGCAATHTRITCAHRTHITHTPHVTHTHHMNMSHAHHMNAH